ncbi:MAG: ATP-dependent RNA helicase HrpA [Pseudomonadota bacterium]
MATQTTKAKQSRRRKSRRGQPGRVAPGELARLAQVRAQNTKTLDLSINPDLPVFQAVEDVSAKLASHQVLVIAGETGSGKTTQLPKLCLAAGLGMNGRIAHTQPRRLAARTVAARIATEVGAELGQEVGFAVRFSDQVADTTRLKVMTDGLLLAELRSDRDLAQYDAIIIDEAHERSLNIDYLLGYLRGLLKRRPELKLIITSATIDVDRFAKFFKQQDVPILKIPGRSYPVEVCYQEPSTLPLSDQILEVIEQIERRPRGLAPDVLVFLSGEQEIFHTAKVLRRHAPNRFSVLPLYARLSFREQQKVFQRSSGLRRIVLATNVAETSLTVPGIGYVIDPGFARINRYSYRSKLQRLPVEPISQASADQRKGRCGRIAPGVCFRLYDEGDFQARPHFTDPEIRRVNLASVVLDMEAHHLGKIETFPFIDPPDPKAIKDAYTLLRELDALADEGITQTGRLMARLPIDPRLGRMLVEANKQGALREALVVCAALAVVDPRERPMNQREAADTAHEMFQDEKSDFLALLNLWRWIEEKRVELTRSRYERALQKRFINPQRVREWRELHRQLRTVVKDLGWRESDQQASYAALHESVLSGCLSLIGQHDEKGHYFGARNLKLRIFPGSSLGQKTPRWIMAAEIAETSRVYARNVSFIEPKWLEHQGRHLLKHRFSEPFWSGKRGEVLATQSSSLYGLQVVDGRRVPYSKIDPVIARDIFIREGLVRGQIAQPPGFLKHNLEQMAQVMDLEAKGRRRDLLISEDDIYAFYANLIPADVCRVTDLNRWLKRNANVEALMFDRQMLMNQQQQGLDVDQFPGHLEIEGVALKVTYKFAPGEIDDGVTIWMPVSILGVVNAEWVEWGIPGFLPNLLESWLRTLPKQKRKQLVPLPDKVTELSQALLNANQFRKGRLLSALGTLIQDRLRVAVSEADWDRERVEEHLFPFIKVCDENGKVLQAGRDLRVLKARLLEEDANRDDVQNVGVDEQTLTQFPEESLPDQIITGPKTAPIVRFPGLARQGQQVTLRYFASQSERNQAMRLSLSQLAVTHLGQAGQYFRKELNKHKELGLYFVSLGNAEELKEELLLNSIWFCFFEKQDLPETRREFEHLVEERRPLFAKVFNETLEVFAQILKIRFECVTQLDGLDSPAYVESKEHIQDQLARLAPKDLLTKSQFSELFLRLNYLEAMRYRISNLPGRVPKDRQLIGVLDPLQARIDAMADQELFDPERAHALAVLLFEVSAKEFAQGAGAIRQKKGLIHPVDQVFGSGWKASIQRLTNLIKEEEMRLGLR